MSHVIYTLETTLQLSSKLWVDWVSVARLLIQRHKPKCGTYVGHIVIMDGAGAIKANPQKGL